jgi:cyclopropane fatty-acyl-phospholipid synthase-like methyltransferase
MTDHYDRLYSGVNDAFGARAEPLLVEHVALLDPALPVLDVGAGQGRNALFLARRGLVVDAIDPSRVAVEQLAAAAKAEGLRLTAVAAGFEGFEPTVARYGAVLLFGLLQLLSREQIERLRGRVESWTAAGALLLVTSFTTLDPGHGRSQVVKTHLAPGELPGLFGTGWEATYFDEGWGPEHHHGDGQLQRHHVARAVLRRR